jgi:hypothetical protein
MKQVGYLTKYPDGLVGERGLFFDYVLAANGLFIEAEGKLMAARVPVAECEVRGLAPLGPIAVLRNGKPPQHIFDLALGAMLTTPDKERYVAITYDDGYHVFVPAQDAKEAHIDYTVPDSVAIDLHSHGRMGAFFSGGSCNSECSKCARTHCDTRDDKGLKIYGVVGELGAIPIVKLRVGVYGYYAPISWGEVFDGSLVGAKEHNDREEVMAIELQSDDGESHPEVGHHGGRMWWHRWLRR